MDSQDGPGRIRLSGQQTLRNCEQLQATLLAALASRRPVVVDAAAVSEADLSAVQALLAARRTARAQGTPFTLAAPASGALLDVLRRGGFVADDGSGGRPDADFWLQGADSP